MLGIENWGHQILSELPGLSVQELTWLALGLVLLFAAAFATFRLKRGRARTRTVRKVQQQFNGLPVEALTGEAYFYGVERIWDSQWRGYGVLLLTREMLYFRLWDRNLDITIPKNRIEEVGIGYGKGRALFRRKCIKVVYTGVDGHIRAAMWLAEKPRNWVSLIRRNLLENASDGETAQEKRLS